MTPSTPAIISKPPDEPPPPPYGIIKSELLLGKAIPFLGAGASRLAPAPSSAAGISPVAPHVLLPSGSQLAQDLAGEAGFPSDANGERSDLAKVSSYYVDGSNRDARRLKLRRVFTNANYQANQLHTLLAEIANGEQLEGGSMFVTTNYDNLLETAFINANKPYDLIVYPADNKNFANGLLWWENGAVKPKPLKPNELDVDDFKRKNIIYKMHGSVHPDSDEWDGFVITEEDYINFLSRMKSAVPGAFRTYFKSREFLYLGYGLQDWNFRVLLREVSSKDRVSWAIKFEPTQFERKVWVRRNVDVFDLKLEDFVEGMRSVP